MTGMSSLPQLANLHAVAASQTYQQQHENRYNHTADAYLRNGGGNVAKGET